MTRIGIDARMMFFTGIGRHVYNLAKRLPLLDPETEYLIFIRPEDRARVDFAAANLRLVETIPTYYDMVEQTRHRRILEAEKLDLLHVPHFNIPIFYHGRLVVTIHDLIQAKLPSQSTWKAQFKRLGYYFVIQQALRKARRVIAVSRFTRDDIVRTLGTAADKIEVIHNGFDARFLRQPTGVAEGKAILEKYGLKPPFLLYVGLQSHHKNLATLIEAMQQIHATHPQASLALVGKHDDRYTPALQAQAQKLGLAEAVRFCGFVPDADLELLYGTAVAFVFPSLYEGFGIPPVEALAAGLPVISSNAASLPEVLGDQATYFDPTDPADMAAKIGAVLVDPESHRPTGMPQFSWDKMAEQTLKTYRQVLAT